MDPRRQYHDTVDTFIAWSDEILNWHCAGRPSNGRIEGTNNLLQVLRRTAHGFTNPRNFEARRREQAGHTTTLLGIRHCYAAPQAPRAIVGAVPVLRTSNRILTHPERV